MCLLSKNRITSPILFLNTPSSFSEGKPIATMLGLMSGTHMRQGNYTHTHTHACTHQVCTHKHTSICICTRMYACTTTNEPHPYTYTYSVYANIPTRIAKILIKSHYYKSNLCIHELSPHYPTKFFNPCFSRYRFG